MPFAPWPMPISGDAIIRRSTMFYGSNGGLWSHASTFGIGQNVVGDFNGDALVNGTDIDLLIDAVNRGSQNAEYVTSGTIPPPDELEVDFYIRDFLNSHFGDANLDGSVDGIDFGIWKDHVFTSCSGWANADFNGDGVTDVSDFNIWNDNKFQMAAAATVLEKATPRAPIALEIAVSQTYDWQKLDSQSGTLRYVDKTFAVGFDRGEGLSVNHLTRKLHRDRQAARRTVDKSNERLVDQAFIDLDLIQDNL